jgi:predicted dehydrogenase
MRCRVGVIGCTGVGTQHASGLIGLENVELVAGCDLSSAVLERFQDHWRENWPDLTTYTSHKVLRRGSRRIHSCGGIGAPFLMGRIS